MLIYIVIVFTSYCNREKRSVFYIALDPIVCYASALSLGLLQYLLYSKISNNFGIMTKKSAFFLLNVKKRMSKDIKIAKMTINNPFVTFVPSRCAQLCGWMLRHHPHNSLHTARPRLALRCFLSDFIAFSV